jgi:hypothetical protein
MWHQATSGLGELAIRFSRIQLENWLRHDRSPGDEVPGRFSRWT